MTLIMADTREDSCFDVPHKKRGRPRLREEHDFQMETAMTQPMTPTAGPSMPRTTPGRPIARTRHQRTESLRSLRSQTSDGSSGSSLPTPSFPPVLQPAWMYQPPRPPSSGTFAAPVPTAYLDLDLNFIRANRPFQQIIANDEELSGRRLQDLVTSADAEPLSGIRGRLKAEREARDPAFMPPIIPMGEDPLYGVREDDLDRLSHGFSDHTYTWTRSVITLTNETFPARVRLAKAAAYFVIVTLPSFRPMEMLPPQPIAPASSPGYLIPPPRVPLLQGQLSQPRMEMQPSPHVPFPPTGRPVSRQQATLGSSRYPQPFPAAQQFHPSQAYAANQPVAPQPPTSRFSVGEPPTSVPPATPLAASMRPPPQSMQGLQLPPLTEPPAQASSREQQRLGESEVPQRSSDDEGEQSPKKRRRMDINEVLR